MELNVQDIIDKLLDISVIVIVVILLLVLLSIFIKLLKKKLLLKAKTKKQRTNINIISQIFRYSDLLNIEWVV